MREDETIPELSLLGGPLYRLGCRLGLVRRATNTERLGVVLGLSSWVALILLAVIEGLGRQLFSLEVIGVHVRLLVAIPLFFVCETWVAPQMAEFAHYIVRSGLVVETSLPALALAIQGLGRMKDSWLAEGLLLVAAFASPALEMRFGPPGAADRWVSIVHSARGGVTWINVWYLGFCLPLFRFLLLRWLWRLGLWWHFLWRVARLKLRLVPTHPDGAAGLGYLEIVHEQFVPLAMALSALLSAQFAEEIVSGKTAFETLYRLIPMVLLLMAGLFMGPLCMFCAKLWNCYWTGMSEYMGMASRYANAFDSKWIRDPGASGESQLGSADLQSLSDLSGSLNVVRGMRTVPIGKRFLKELAVAVILPLLPLLLLKYPAEQVAAQLIKLMIGF
jgi:hypothetical protein